MNDTLIIIDGVDCTAGLTKYDIDEYDKHSSDSGTNIKGKEIVKIIRGNNYKISLEWKNISTSYKNKILNTLKKGNSIPVRFAFDSEETLKSITTAYRGDRSISLVVNNGTDRLWDLSFSLIEI